MKLPQVMTIAISLDGIAQRKIDFPIAYETKGGEVRVVLGNGVEREATRTTESGDRYTGDDRGDEDGFARG